MKSAYVIITCLMIATFNTYGQPGSLDLTFGTLGKVTTSFGTSSSGNSVALQSDGKIVVAGTNYGSFALARYNTDGSLDNFFGTGGKVVTPIAGASAQGKSVAIQSDGKIIVVGYSWVNAGNYYNGNILRYNTDGSLDNSFDGNGIYTLQNPPYDVQFYAVAIQGDGRSVIAGIYAGSSMTMRFNTNGISDNTYGSSGISLLVPYTITLTSLIIQIDGKIVVAGSDITTFMLARLNTDGSRDSFFGSSGIVIASFAATSTSAASIRQQPDGKIIVAGYIHNGSTYDFLLVRYNSNGSLDNTFGTNGEVSTSIDTTAFGNSVAIQDDGKIIVAGSAYVNSIENFALACYNSNGSLDNSFGLNGVVTTSFGTGASGNSVALQSDGKIVIAGTNTASISYFALARYNPDLATTVPQESFSEISVYPNPFQEFINIPNARRGTIYSIYSNSGRLLINGVLTNNQKIQTDNLAAGGYLIKWVDENKTFVVKLIK